MKNENEKKGFFTRLAGSKKANKGSCCCNFELEEIPEENTENKVDKPAADNKNSCC